MADLIVPAISVYRRSDGALLYNAPAHLKPNDADTGWTTLPAGYDETLWSWDSTSRTMKISLPALETSLIQQVKREAEELKMGDLSSGGAKKTEYAEKAAEVRFFYSLAGTLQGILGVIGLWTVERREIVFPWATEDAAENGDTFDKAIARFLEGMRKARRNRKVGGREQKLCRNIRLATTAAAKQAIFDARNWPAT